MIGSSMTKSFEASAFQNPIFGLNRSCFVLKRPNTPTQPNGVSISLESELICFPQPKTAITWSTLVLFGSLELHPSATVNN